MAARIVVSLRLAWAGGGVPKKSYSHFLIFPAHVLVGKVAGAFWLDIVRKMILRTEQDLEIDNLQNYPAEIVDQTAKAIGEGCVGTTRF